VIHGLRGRISNRKLAAKIQRQALTILKQPDWHDFGPTFAAEQLGKQHRIHVGKETLCGWMTEAGLWKSKPRKIQQVTFGDRGGADSENWFSGTPPSTIGWRAEGRCALWFG